MSMSNNTDMFLCPITGCIMSDPVIGTDGYTYERSAITTWLNTKRISPMTKLPMSIHDLTPNRALKDAIEEFKAKNGTLPVSNPTVNTINFVPAVKKVKLNTNVIYYNDQHNKSKTKLHVKVTPDIATNRQPTAFIFVLDVSGSMGQAASLKNAGEQGNLSVLDLVKHSVKTVINVLKNTDMVSIITFSNYAKSVMKLTVMTDANKTKTIKLIDDINVDGQTNIWDGLRLAIEEISQIKDMDINTNIVLLTDGEPNLNPPRGIVDTLSDTLASTQFTLPYTISTFGFGNSLDSQLLNSISYCGSGTYGYIPDSSMVGTIFVSWIANALSTYIQSSKVRVTFDNPNQTPIEQNIGSLLFDQSRDLIFDVPTNCNAKIEYLINGQVITTKDISIDQSLTLNYNGFSHVVRYEIIETVNNVLENNSQPQTVEELFNIIKSLDTIDMPVDEKIKINSYLYDYYPTSELKKKNKGGQINEALQSNYYHTWGAHYLRSLMNAYSYQQCNNFKDPGVQLFGGNLFKTIRDNADEIFCKMPAPVPKTNVYNACTFGGFTATSAYATRCMTQPVAASAYVPVSMSSYHNASSICFDGESLVHVPGGQVKVKMLTKGMDVWSVNKFNVPIITKVLCVVKTKTTDNEANMCQLNGMYITPYHPVKIYEKWVFPQSITNVYSTNLDYIYNIVLESGHVLNINGIKVSTMGHDFEDNDVIKHPYFGSNKVIEDLKTNPGWDYGLIIFNNLQVERTDGYISRMYESS